MTFSIIEHAHNDFITVTKLATVQAVKGRKTQYSCTAVEISQDPATGRHCQKYLKLQDSAA